MTILIILFLIFLGILLLLIEFTIIPGITIAGVGGFLLLGASVYMAFDTYGVLPGIITLSFVLIIVPILFYKFFKSKSGKKMVLESEITGRVDEIDNNNIHIGDEGMTIGRLAPTGKVKINNQTMEAKAVNGFIDHQVKIKVVEILKTQVIVEPINQE